MKLIVSINRETYNTLISYQPLILHRRYVKIHAFSTHLADDYAIRTSAESCGHRRPLALFRTRAHFRFRFPQWLVRLWGRIRHAPDHIVAAARGFFVSEILGAM